MSHRWHLPEPGRWMAVAAPAGVAMLLIGGLACMLLAISVREADDLVIKRDRSLAASILQQAVDRIAHDQESVTAWDEAVIRLHGPRDPDWMDDNIGTWMNMYFGYERIVVLDPHDQPIYASIGARRSDPSSFEEIAPFARPLMAEVRRVLEAGTWKSPEPSVRSPGAEDIVVIDGHPAMLSVKPVVPSTDKVRQATDDAYMHVAVHYLDGSFLGELQQRFLFEKARFSWQNKPTNAELSFALRNNRGQAIGFLIWKAPLPGQMLAARMVPALVFTLVAILAVVAVLVVSLRKGAHALRMSEARARHIAFHDALSGLPNRAAFNEKLAVLCREGDVDTTLFLLDLDRFKQVNDTLGHPAGDELIRLVGERLLQVAPDGAMVARLGGDEFAVLLARMSQTASIRLAHDIVATIDAPFPIQGTQVDVGVSIGMASMRDATTSETLIRQADQALYRSKKAGGGLMLADERELMGRTVQPIAA